MLKQNTEDRVRSILITADNGLTEYLLPISIWLQVLGLKHERLAYLLLKLRVNSLPSNFLELFYKEETVLLLESGLIVKQEENYHLTQKTKNEIDSIILTEET